MVRHETTQTAEHVVLIAHKITGPPAGKYYRHTCTDSWCTQTCYIRHNTAHDAAGCATMFHRVPCICYGAELQVIHVTASEGLFT